MVIFMFRRVAVVFFTVLLIPVAFGQTLIKVVDQNEAPLANVVIEYLPPKLVQEIASEQLKKTQPQDTIYVMDQMNKSFVPELLVIPKNSLVSFPNSDDIRHHVYSFSAAKTFELKLYAGKPKSPLRFENEGVVVMGCNIHDAMVGYIYVSNQKDYFISNEQGEVTLDTELVPKSQLQLWHSNAKVGVDNRTLINVENIKVTQGVLTLVLPVNSPVARDSFENLFTHTH